MRRAGCKFGGPGRENGYIGTSGTDRLQPDAIKLSSAAKTLRKTGSESINQLNSQITTGPLQTVQ